MYSSSRPNSSAGGGGVGRPTSSNPNSNSRKNHSHFRSSSQHSTNSPSLSPSPQLHDEVGLTSSSISPTHSDFTLTQPYYPYVYYYYNSPFHGVLSSRAGNHRPHEDQVHQSQPQHHRYGSPGKKMLNGNVPTFRPVTFSQFTAARGDHPQQQKLLNDSDILPASTTIPKTMTPNGVLTGAIDQAVKSKRRQRKGSYSTGVAEKPPPPPPEFSGDQLNHPNTVTNHNASSNLFQANNNNHNHNVPQLHQHSSNSAKVSQQQQSSPNPTTTPQSLSLSLSEDSATTFDSTQPVISPKSTSGGSSFRSGGGSSRQSGGKGRSSCLSTLCWYTLVFFVLLIVFGVAFGAGFAVAKYLFNPDCDSSSSSSSFSSSSSSHNPLLQSNSARNYANPLFNSQPSQNNNSSPSSMLTVPVADNLMKITTQSLAPSLRDGVIEMTPLPPAMTTTTKSTSTISPVNVEGRSNSDTDSREEDSDTQNNGPQQQHKSADSSGKSENPSSSLSPTEPPQPTTTTSSTASNVSTVVAENKTASRETTEAPYSFDFGTDFNLEQIDPLLSNTDSIIEELFRSTRPTTGGSSNENTVATTIAPPVSTQIPASSNSKFQSTNSSSFSEANLSSSSTPPPSSSSSKPPTTTDAALVEPVPQSTELPPPPPKSIAPINDNSTSLIDVHQLPFSVQPSAELTPVAANNSSSQQQQQTTTLPSNQPFIPMTTTTASPNDSIEPSTSTTLDAKILDTNVTATSERGDTTVTQMSAGEEVERRETKSVDLDLNRKAEDFENDGNQEAETVAPAADSAPLSNLPNSTTEELLPPLPTVETVTVLAETDTTLAVSSASSSSTTLSPSASDAPPVMLTSDMPFDVAADDKTAKSNTTTETAESSETLPTANLTTAADPLLFLGTSEEANFTDISNTGDAADAAAAVVANSTITTETISETIFPLGNRTGNERALTDGNWTATTSSATLGVGAHISSSNETASNSTNGRLVSPSLKTPEGSLASGPVDGSNSNNVVVQDICLESQFTCPRLPIVSTIAPKARRSVTEETTVMGKSLQPTTTRCLPQSYLCNGVVDCLADGFDEMNCGEIKCGLNFMCGGGAAVSLNSSFSSTSDLMASGSTVVSVATVALSGGNETLTTLSLNGSSFSSTTTASSLASTQAPTMCIPRQLYCDGVYDCKNGEDEIECKISKCQANEIRCVDGSACITAKMACDGVYHCKDHSDEKGCVSKSSCESAGRFFCDNGLCIDKVLHCDGKRDCSDDEQNCPTLESCTSLGKFYCHTSHECIDAAMQCDGVQQCLDRSDEDFCFENDLDGVVHVFNSASKLWSLLCVPERDFFTTLEADDLCARLGQQRATNYTLIEVSRLIGASTWATVVNANASLVRSSGGGSSGPQFVGALAQYSQNITHSTSCGSNLTVAVQCTPYSCSAGSSLQVGRQQPQMQQQQQNLLNSGNDTAANESVPAFPAPPPVAIEVPEEVVPTPLYISARNGSTGDQAKCMAYAVGSNWLLTSGLCLNNHFHSTLLKDVHVTNGNGSLSVSVEQLRLHPQYSIFRTIRFPDYDMALVQTAQVLDGWTLAHSSICLPAAKLDAEITCFIGGTGGGGEFGGQNNDVAFEVKEMSYCNASQHYNGIITERTFCAERSTGREEPSACLPPYLPLLCLTSKSQWYLSGFISYQRGCHELTSLTNLEKLPNFRGYFKHPTVFSNFFIMRDFIEHTLGLGTYMKSRPKLELSDNGSFIPTLMPPIESVGGQHSQVGGIYANYRAAYVRRDEETVVAAGPEPPPQLVTPDARLQKSLNLSSPDMKSENITESISKMIELSPGSAVEAAAAAPLGNGTTATTTTIPTTTITPNISDITIPITTTIAPSFAEEILTTIATDTGTFINLSKENNSSSIGLDEKPVEVQSSSTIFNETKSEASETLIDANDMVIEGSGFAPETPEPVAKDVAQQPTLASMLGNELTTQSDSALTGNSNAQIEETAPATTTVLPFLNSADEVLITTTTPTIFSSPPELNESLPDQFTTTTLPTTTSAEEIETTESVFTLKGNATNSSHSSPTVTTFMPEKRSNVFRVEDASNSTGV